MSARIEAGAGARHAGEAGSLLVAMQYMSDQLASSIARLRSGAASLSRGTGQLACGGRQLSLRTEQQAAALGEAAGAMHLLGTGLHLHADQARLAASLGLSATDTAAANARAIAALAADMGGLAAADDKMSGIVSAIDDLAFEASTLALNTAVEAARTGRQNEGLCIVASEVRALAQRATAAAGALKLLMGDTRERSAAGTALASQAGRALNQAASDVQRVSALVAGIADAGSGHAASIIELSDTIGAMERASRQHAALADDSVQLAAELRDEAGHLSRLVDAFLLGPEHAQPAPRIVLVANNPGKLSTPARAVRACATVVPVHGKRGGALP